MPLLLLLLSFSFALGACASSTPIQKDCGADGAVCDSGTPGPRPPGCPETWDDGFGEACATEGLRCEYGEECCCGRCAASMVLVCIEESWSGHATDFCYIPSCEGVPCDRSTTCAGYAETVCVEGTCEPPAACREIDDPERCVATDGCSHYEPGCTDGPSALGGCFPASGCAEDGGCPDGLTCRTISVDPCDGGDVPCGACAADVQVCMEP